MVVEEVEELGPLEAEEDAVAHGPDRRAPGLVHLDPDLSDRLAAYDVPEQLSVGGLFQAPPDDDVTVGGRISLLVQAGAAAEVLSLSQRGESAELLLVETGEQGHVGKDRPEIHEWR